MMDGLAFLFVCFGVLGAFLSVMYVAYARGRDMERERANEENSKRIRRK